MATRARNSKRRYGGIAMVLHWTMAMLMIALVILGLYMSRLPEVGFNTLKIRLIIAHKEIGILVLWLAALRFAWRFGDGLPSPVRDMPEWQKVAARFVHLCFYALMFALPITGWLMSSAAGLPVSFFGLFDLPDFIDYNEGHFETLLAIHKALGYTLIPFICVHVGAALHHHFIARDATLDKMLPEGASRVFTASVPAAAPSDGGRLP